MTCNHHTSFTYHYTYVMKVSNLRHVVVELAQQLLQLLLSGHLSDVGIDLSPVNQVLEL